MTRERLGMRITVDVYGPALDALLALEKSRPKASVADIVRRALVEAHRREVETKK